MQGVGSLPRGGETGTLSVSGLDMTSLGAPANSALQVGVQPAAGDGSTPLDVGTFPVVDGAATVTLPMPGIGAYVLVMRAADSSTVVTLPVTVVSELPPATTPTATPGATPSADPTATAGPTRAATPTKGSQLATTGLTGAASFATTAAAVGLLAVGGLLLVLARRRRG